MKILKLKKFVYTLIIATTVSNVSVAKSLYDSEKEAEVANSFSLFEYLFNKDEHRTESINSNKKEENNNLKVKPPIIRPSKVNPTG